MILFCQNKICFNDKVGLLLEERPFKTFPLLEENHTLINKTVKKSSLIIRNYQLIPLFSFKSKTFQSVVFYKRKPATNLLHFLHCTNEHMHINQTKPNQFTIYFILASFCLLSFKHHYHFILFQISKFSMTITSEQNKNKNQSTYISDCC